MLSLCLAQVRWCPDTLVGLSFYRVPELNKETRIKQIYSNSTQRYGEFLLNKSKAEHVFFAFYPYSSTRIDFQLNDLSQGIVKGIKIYKIAVPNESDVGQAVIDFLKPIVQIGLDHNEMYPEAIEYLVRTFEFKQDVDNVKKYLLVYKNVNQKQFNYFLEYKVKEYKL